MGKLRQHTHTQNVAKMTRLGRVLAVALLLVVVAALVLAAPPPPSSAKAEAAAKAEAEGRRRRACPAEPLAPGDYDFTISSDGLQR